MPPTGLTIVFTACLLWLLQSLSLLPPTSFRADMGPKPRMDFYFSYPHAPVEIIQGELFLCDDFQCLQPRSWKQLDCTSRHCRAILLNTTKYYKLTITFEDARRQSHVFSPTSSLYASFAVTVNQDSLSVREISDRYFAKSFIFALAITIAIELAIAILVCRVIRFNPFRKPVSFKSITLLILAANLISLPIVWFVFPIAHLQPKEFFLLSEIFAVVYETIFLYLILKKKSLGLKHAFLLSLTMSHGCISEN